MVTQVMSTRRTHVFFLALILVGLTIAKTGEVIDAPSSPNVWQSWISDITAQRTKDLKSVHYNGSIYDVPDLVWTQSSFIQPQMHGYDAYFYDITTHSYTMDKWIDDLNARYGGIDAFLFWVTYTNIGVDDRNQFDLMLAVPGGIDALRTMVDHMHSKYDIKVLFPYNPWDQGHSDSVISVFLNFTYFYWNRFSNKFFRTNFPNIFSDVIRSGN